MTAQDRLTFRQCLLAQLTRCADGYPISTLRIGASCAGHLVSDDEIEAELAGYLAREGFVAKVPNPLNPAAPRYKLTAAGMAYAQASALA